jgi:hypothetical protein
MPTRSKNLGYSDHAALTHAENAIKAAQRELEPVVRGQAMLPSDMRNRSSNAFAELAHALESIGNIFRRPRQPEHNGNGHNGNGDHE